MVLCKPLRTPSQANCPMLLPRYVCKTWCKLPWSKSINQPLLPDNSYIYNATFKAGGNVGWDNIALHVCSRISLLVYKVST